MKRIKNMLKFFSIILLMMALIAGGCFALCYSLINALLYISAFIVGVTLTVGGLLLLREIADKLK